MKYIPLTQGRFAIVDDEDYGWLMEWKWFAHKSGNTFYARRNCKGKTIDMHRLILDAQPGAISDHINHNGLDNCRRNLRPCNRSQNMQNQLPRGGTSKYKGVQRNRGRWQASIEYMGKKLNFSRHTSEIDAARAYNDKARELFGEFACINDLLVMNG